MAALLNELSVEPLVSSRVQLVSHTLNDTHTQTAAAAAFERQKDDIDCWMSSDLIPVKWQHAHRVSSVLRYAVCIWNAHYKLIRVADRDSVT